MTSSGTPHLGGLSPHFFGVYLLDPSNQNQIGICPCVRFSFLENAVDLLSKTAKSDKVNFLVFYSCIIK